MTEEEDLTPRVPKMIQKELRNRLDRMNSDEGFTHSKNAEECALAIQRLQKELAVSMKFHIGLVPPPGKLLLI